MFDTLIGQDAIKRRLSHYAEGYAKTRTVPFLFFVGAKGLGKTHFAREFAKELKMETVNVKKPFVEINSSTIGSLKQFLETLYVPVIMGNEMTVLFDECHDLPKKLVTAFLTVLNTEKSTTRVLRTPDGEYDFDFKQLTFMFATTEPDQVFAPLKDRLKRIDFAPYSDSELSDILKLNMPDVKVGDEVMKEIASVFRGNARDAVAVADEINRYCDIRNKVSFAKKDWDSLKHTLNIMPLGLNHSEVQVLQLLHNRGPQSLQMLSASTGLSRRALQREVENYLMARGLMDIDGQRRITESGVKVLQEVAEK